MTKDEYAREWRFEDATLEELQILYDLIPTLSPPNLARVDDFVNRNDYWFASEDCETGVKWLIAYLQNQIW
jgi:hypothetical protein